MFAWTQRKVNVRRVSSRGPSRCAYCHDDNRQFRWLVCDSCQTALCSPCHDELALELSACITDGCHASIDNLQTRSFPKIELRAQRRIKVRAERKARVFRVRFREVDTAKDLRRLYVIRQLTMPRRRGWLRPDLISAAISYLSETPSANLLNQMESVLQRGIRRGVVRSTGDKITPGWPSVLDIPETKLFEVLNELRCSGEVPENSMGQSLAAHFAHLNYDVEARTAIESFLTRVAS